MITNPYIVAVCIGAMVISPVGYYLIRRGRESFHEWRCPHCGTPHGCFGFFLYPFNPNGVMGLLLIGSGLFYTEATCVRGCE